jgi:hypothetical protein
MVHAGAVAGGANFAGQATAAEIHRAASSRTAHQITGVRQALPRAMLGMGDSNKRARLGLGTVPVGNHQRDKVNDST